MEATMRAALLGMSLSLVCDVALANSVKASSELVDDDGVEHPAALAFDGLITTAWAEGEMGAGDGSWLELTFKNPTNISSVSIWAGDMRRGVRSLKENGRPRLVSVILDDADDEPVEVQARIGDVETHGVHRVDVAIEGLSRKVRIRVDEGLPGFLRNDLYIAEVAVNFRGGEQPADSLAALESFIASPKGEKALASHREYVVGLFDRVDTSEFGDREAFADLADLASDGAPWLREQVLKTIPEGFRAQALPADSVAVEALLKIRDANAIPALGMAATRAKGRDQRKLEKQVTYFRAYSELQGGPRRNLDTWGTPGWEAGALQSFGEPLGVVQGAYGDLYVADTANHRVSVFRPDGTTREVWGGGEAVVTDVWLSGKRAHYVGGASPVTSDGGFTCPVDIEIVEEKNGERVVVLDARRRVQWFGGDGKFLGGWKFQSEGDISSGVGGEAHVLVVRDKVVAIWGNEAIVFEEDGTEVSRWPIEDGVPSAAVTLKNGKVAFGFAGKVVAYDLDGYRQGVMFGGDQLPAGAEFWDMRFDEKGKLWIVTDNGLAVKFKRPGKVDYQVTWTTQPVSAPRFTVRDDMLHITDSGRIYRVDALEVKAEAELAEEEAAVE
jgi:hypothetical protein